MIKFKKLSSLIPWKRNLLTIVVLSVGLGLSLLSFDAMRSSEQRELRAEFIRAANERIFAIEKQVDTTLLILESMHSLYITSEEIVQAGFYGFSQPFVTQLGGVQALGWVPRVQANQREEFESEMRQKGIQGFQIMERGPQGTMVRARQRQEYFPASDVGPEEVGETSVGFDEASDPKRKEALERARDTGEIAATAPVALVQETQGQFGFLLFLPVYRKSMPNETVEDRRKSLQGFIMGVFRVSDIVDAAVSGMSPEDINLSISDESAPEGQRTLYDHAARADLEPLASVDDSSGGHIQQVSNFALNSFYLLPGVIRRVAFNEYNLSLDILHS